MLINGGTIVRDLKKEIDDRLLTLVQRPPKDYPSFMLEVGAIRSKLELVDVLKAAATTEED